MKLNNLHEDQYDDLMGSKPLPDQDQYSEPDYALQDSREAGIFKFRYWTEMGYTVTKLERHGIEVASGHIRTRPDNWRLSTKYTTDPPLDKAVFGDLIYGTAQGSTWGGIPSNDQELLRELITASKYYKGPPPQTLMLNGEIVAQI